MIDFNKKNFDDESEASCETTDTRDILKKKVHDINYVLKRSGTKITYINSGSTGHTFKGTFVDDDGEVIEFAMKIVPYDMKRHGTRHDSTRPENAELLMIKLLSKFIVNKMTPHLVLPIATFDTKTSHLPHLFQMCGVNSKHEKAKKCKNFLTKYEQGKYYDDMSVLISEWANRGDFLTYIKDNYKQITPIHWKAFMFQIVVTLAIIQSEYPSFRHNDLKANNILLTKTTKNKKRYPYEVYDKKSNTRLLFGVPDISYRIHVWDFDFACIPGEIDNIKVMANTDWTRSINIGPVQNRYYDLHYFFNTLAFLDRDAMIDKEMRHVRAFFPKIVDKNNKYIPNDLADFICDVVPVKYRNTDNVAPRGRILVNDEYVTPLELLKHPYFEEFLVATENTKMKHTGGRYRSRYGRRNRIENITEVNNSRNRDYVRQILMHDDSDKNNRISESVKELNKRNNDVAFKRDPRIRRSKKSRSKRRSKRRDDSRQMGGSSIKGERRSERRGSKRRQSKRGTRRSSKRRDSKRRHSKRTSRTTDRTQRSRSKQRTERSQRSQRSQSKQRSRNKNKTPNTSRYTKRPRE
jgi:hypothetical protein